MNKAILAAAAALGGLSVATTALAGPSLAEAWYVKKDAKADAMLTDRAACVIDAQQFGVDRASDFSNPEYGSLTALGAALDEDALHGGAKQAVRRAVRDACMQKKGWTKVDVSETDAKALKKAGQRNTGPLDAWMSANADKVPPPPAPKVAPKVAATPAATPIAAPTPAKAPDPAAPHS